MKECNSSNEDSDCEHKSDTSWEDEDEGKLNETVWDSSGRVLSLTNYQIVKIKKIQNQWKVMIKVSHEESKEFNDIFWTIEHLCNFRTQLWKEFWYINIPAIPEISYFESMFNNEENTTFVEKVKEIRGFFKFILSHPKLKDDETFISLWDKFFSLEEDELKT